MADNKQDSSPVGSILSGALAYKPVMPTFTKFEDRPEVHKAMQGIWEQTHSGTLRAEATFLVNRDGSIVNVPFTNEYKSQRVPVSKDTVALFHVHPNGTNPLPSTPQNAVTAGTSDTQVADKLGIPIYAVSKAGLAFYDPKDTSHKDGKGRANPQFIQRGQAYLASRR